MNAFAPWPLRSSFESVRMSGRGVGLPVELRDQALGGNLAVGVADEVCELVPVLRDVEVVNGWEKG